MSNLCQTTGASHGEMWGCAQPRWNMEHWNIMELCGMHMIHWVAHWTNIVTSLCGIPWRFYSTRETVFCQLNTLNLGHVHGYLPMESEPRTKGDQVGSLWMIMSMDSGTLNHVDDSWWFSVRWFWGRLIFFSITMCMYTYIYIYRLYRYIIYIYIYNYIVFIMILNGFGMSAVQTNPYHSRLFSPCATRLWIGSAWSEERGVL